MSSAKGEAEFGKLRGFFWPVYAFELKKVLPMFFMLFCINFNYTILRDMKDPLVINAPGCDASIISFLKLYCTVPAAFLFMALYIKMSNVLDKQKLFYATLSPFLVFFLLYATVFYPNASLIHPSSSAVAIENALNSIGLSGLAPMVDVYRNWSTALFYVFAELWGSVVLSLLFWRFANEITQVKEAKRFYAVFLMGAQVAMLCSGPIIKRIAHADQILEPYIGQTADPMQLTLNILTVIVVVMGLGTMFCYNFVNKKVLTDKRFYDPSQIKTKKKSKPKMGVGESLRYLASDRYVMSLAFLVLAYGMSINMVETYWKGMLKVQYPSKNDYLAFMGDFSWWTGFTTLVLLFVASGNVIRKMGWGFAASVTPTILLITGLIFFGCYLFPESVVAALNGIGIQNLEGHVMLGFLVNLVSSPVMMMVIVGMVQNIASKSSKYSLFDPTKEMAYIPLPEDERGKAKAAIDVVGGRLGKSGGAFILFFSQVAVGAIWGVSRIDALNVAAPVIGLLVIAIILGWLAAVRSLNVRFVAATEAMEADTKKKEAEKTEPAVPHGVKPATA